MLSLTSVCVKCSRSMISSCDQSRTSPTSHSPGLSQALLHHLQEVSGHVISYPVLGGHTLEDWMDGLSSVSYVSLVGSAATGALMLLLICESNFLRRAGQDGHSSARGLLRFHRLCTQTITENALRK